MSSPLPWIDDALQDLASQGLLRRRRIVRLLTDGYCEIDGRAVLDFASNDYLNLSRDPRVVAAAAAALHQGSVGARASPLVCGRQDWHQRLEQKIAAFEGHTDALLFPTGMAANIGTVAALCQPGDLILCDRLNHASLVDGCRLSRAQVRVYRHDDLTMLERELTKSAASQRRWIVTDSVFSMDGDLAPLPELCDIAERFDASIIVDEAHGTGVFGPEGRGACELMGVEERVHVRIGTLSKAVGAQGGFVAGCENLIEFLWNRARSQIYSTALAPSICAAATAALEIIQDDSGRRQRLADAAIYLRQQLHQAGVETVTASRGPIIPVILRDPAAAVGVAERLEKRGFLVGAIRPPTVPKETSRLRIVVTSAHQNADLSRLAAAVADEIANCRQRPGIPPSIE